MQNDEQNLAENHQDIEPIKIIDILAVIVRYRKVIVTFTLSAVVLAAAAFVIFISPEKSYVVNPGRYLAQASYQISDIPDDVNGLFNTKINNLVQSYFNSVSLVSKAFAETIVAKDKLYQDVKFTAPGSLESFTSQAVLKNLLKIEINGGGIVTVAFSNDTPELAPEFIKSLSGLVQERIFSDLTPKFQQAIQLLSIREEQVSLAAKNLTPVSAANDNSVLVQSLLTIANQKMILTQLSKDKNFPLLQIGEITTIDTSISGKPQSPSMIILIALIMGFIFSILLAFILDYIRRIRGDELEMAKLRDALRKK